MTPPQTIPDRQSVLAAESVIRPYIRRTPVFSTAASDFGLSGQPLSFKLEFMQHSGTFKARGAFANLLMREGRNVAWSRPRAATMGRRSRMRP